MRPVIHDGRCVPCDVKDIAIFSMLPDPALERLEQENVPRLYGKKQIVHTQGHPSSGIHLIHSGLVKVYKMTPDGGQYITRLTGAGGVLGLPTLFSGIPYLWTAQTVKISTIGFIKRETAVDVVRENSRATVRIIEILTQFLIESENERVELAQGSVRERMARLLVLLSQRHGAPHKNGIRINLAFSRGEMADMLGTASETAMRLLKTFREDKLVEVRGREIVVLDRDRLAEIASMNAG